MYTIYSFAPSRTSPLLRGIPWLSALSSEIPLTRSYSKVSKVRHLRAWNMLDAHVVSGPQRRYIFQFAFSWLLSRLSLLYFFGLRLLEHYRAQRRIEDEKSKEKIRGRQRARARIPPPPLSLLEHSDNCGALQLLLLSRYFTKGTHVRAYNLQKPLIMG